MAGFNGIGWFEIGTSDPAAAKQFYGDVFGWTASDEDPASSGPTYQIITTGDPDGLRGGLFATEGKMPGYACSRCWSRTSRRPAGGPSRRAARSSARRSATRSG